MKKIILTCLLALVFVATWAYDFSDNSTETTIFYNIVTGGVEVTWGGKTEADGTTSYTGHIIIPEIVTYNGETYTVIGLGRCAFYDCRLTTISLPETLEYIGTRAFSCSDITSIVIPDNVTDLGDYSFYLSYYLTDIELGTGVTEIKERTFYKTAIKGIDLGNAITSIGRSAFFGCDLLESIKLPDSLLSIDQQAFDACSSLKEVTFGNSLESLGKMAFSNTAVEEIELPNSLVTIMNGSEFYNDVNLRKFTLGNAVDSLSSSTFLNCTGLEEFYSPIETPPTASRFTFSSSSVSTCVLYVPEGCVDAYKVASGWSLFGDIREMANTSASVASYTDIMKVLIGGEVVLSEEKTFYLTIEMNGTYTLTIDNLVITLSGEDIGIGTIHIPNIVGTQQEGFISLYAEETIEAENGDDPDINIWWGPLVGPMDVVFTGSLTDKLYAYITLKASTVGDLIVEFGDDTTGVSSVSAESATINGIYSVGGQKLNSTVKGVNIIRYADGTTKKLFVK